MERWLTLCVILGPYKTVPSTGIGEAWCASAARISSPAPLSPTWYTHRRVWHRPL